MLMNKINDFLIKKLFIISDEPVKFADLLEANALFLEKMPLESAKLHFKQRIFLSYFVYVCLCFVLFLPILFMAHFVFVKVDTHFGILSAIVMTSIFFIGFDLFRIYTQKLICGHLIKYHWNIHFPYFEYEKYKNLVNGIYKKALEDEVARGRLEQFVFEKIVNINKD